MVRLHHQLNGHEFVQSPGDSGRQGRLACCSAGCNKEWNRISWMKNTNRHLNLGRTDKVGLLGFSIYPCFIHFIKVLNFSQQCFQIFTIEVLYIFVLISFLGSWFFCHCSIKCIVLFSVSFKHLEIQLIFTYWSNHHVKFTYSIKMRMGFLFLIILFI